MSGASPSLAMAGLFSLGPVCTRPLLRTSDHSFWYSSARPDWSCAPGQAVGKSSDALGCAFASACAAQSRKERQGVPRYRNCLRKVRVFSLLGCILALCKSSPAPTANRAEPPFRPSIDKNVKGAGESAAVENLDLGVRNRKAVRGKAVILVATPVACER